MSIGFFDSGVGGLTIWKEVSKRLPNQNTFYLADNANSPYGEKSKNQIIDLSLRNAGYLIAHGAQIVVVACNTATVQAIDALRAQFDIPFVGIEPAVKPAALYSLTRCIGVLATNGTLESAHFNAVRESYSDNLRVITQVGVGLVESIESGGLHSPSVHDILAGHLEVLMKFPIDYLVLGCTHYPLLRPLIQQIIGNKIKIIDSVVPVTLQVQRVMTALRSIPPSIQPALHRIFTTGSPAVLKSICENELDVGKLNIDYSSLYQLE